MGGGRLTREMLEEALFRISGKLKAKDLKGEIAIFGGAAMVLAFNARPSTKDLDSMFFPSEEIRDAAARVADEMGLPADWMNDGVKGFISENHETTCDGLPQFSHLKVTMPVPECLFAMKCMTSRIIDGAGEESQDVADIRFLGAKLGITSSTQALQIVERYFPASKIR